MMGYVPTPPTLVDRMVSKLFRGRRPSADQVLLDPGCGDGAFIEGVLRFCKRVRIEPPRIVGVDVEPELLLEAHERFGKLGNINLIEADYLEKDLGPFDYVTGNPPYVPITEITSRQKDIYRGRFASAKGRFDLYLLFIERALASLRPGGAMCFVTPEKYQYVNTAAPLRRILGTRMLEELDFLDEDTFEGFTTYPVITTASARAPVRGEHTAVKRRDGTTASVLLPRDGSSWAAALSGSRPAWAGGTATKTLADAALRVSCGVATGAESVFVMRLSDVPPQLKTFAHATLSGRHLPTLATEVPEPKEAILMPYTPSGKLRELERLGDFATYLSLPARKRALEARTCVKEGRKNWYAYHDSVPPELHKPKILCKDITSEPHFVLDEGGDIVPRHSLYYIVPEPGVDIEALRDALNSAESKAWLRANCQRAAQGYYRLQSSVLKRLPMPADAGLAK